MISAVGVHPLDPAGADLPLPTHRLSHTTHDLHPADRSSSSTPASPPLPHPARAPSFVGGNLGRGKGRGSSISQHIPQQFASLPATADQQAVQVPEDDTYDHILSQSHLRVHADDRRESQPLDTLSQSAPVIPDLSAAELYQHFALHPSEIADIETLPDASREFAVMELLRTRHDRDSFFFVLIYFH